MTMLRTTLTLGAVLAFAGVSAVSETYTFRVSDGVWNNEQNWNPVGKPQADDKAIIPDGKICRVQEGNQAAHEVDVQAGGTLGIVGKTLTISGQSGTVYLTVNGTLYLKTPLEPRAPVARLVANRPLTIDGNGLVTARRADGYHRGEIEASELQVNSGMTMAGSLYVTCSADLEYYGLLVVDNARDEMHLKGPGLAPPARYLRGTGSLHAKQGGLLIVEDFWMGWDIYGTWWMDAGGTLQVEGCACINPQMYVLITDGGVLDVVSEGLATAGGLGFYDGTIKVAPGKAAFFTYRD